MRYTTGGVALRVYAITAAILPIGLPYDDKTTRCEGRDMRIELAIVTGAIDLEFIACGRTTGVESLCKNTFVAAILVIGLPGNYIAAIGQYRDGGTVLRAKRGLIDQRFAKLKLIDSAF